MKVCPHDGIGALIKEGRDQKSLCHVRTPQEDNSLKGRRRLSPEPDHADTDPGLLAPRTIKNNFFWLSHPVYGICYNN